MSSDRDGGVRYGEENGVVLDKWLFDVCGADDLQFPAHRRQQFPAYLTHVQYVAKQKTFVAGTFSYPSRAGAREVLTLQYTLEALGNREKAFLKRLHEVESSIATVKATLEERTMGMSALPPPTVSRAHTPLPAEIGTSSSSQIAQQRALADGYRALDAPAMPSTAFTPARGEERRTRYAEKKRIAERYVEQKRTEMKTLDAQQRDVAARHETVKAEENQLRNECRALKETEDIVLARQRDTEKRLVELRDRVDAEEASATRRRDGREARLAAAVAAVTRSFIVSVTAVGSETNEDRVVDVVDTPLSPELAALSEGGDSCAQQLDMIDVSEETEMVFGGGEAMMGSDGGVRAGGALVEEEAGVHDTDLTGVVSSSSTCSDHRLSPNHADVDETHTTGDGADGDKALADSEDQHAHSAGHRSDDNSGESEVLARTLTPEARANGNDLPPQAVASPTPRPTTMAPTQNVDTQAVAAASVEAEVTRAELLERLRSQLSKAGARRQELMRTLRNESQVHAGRLRQSQQRLRDWQDIVQSQRRVAEQLQGQVRVLTQVVEDTTERLEAADVANRGGVSGGYGGQLARLNELLKQRTVEHYQAYVGSTNGIAAEAASAAAEETAVLRPLLRPAPGASGTSTPARRGSSVSGTNTPIRGADTTSSSTSPVAAQRSRYDLVRHLQRWETALQSERAQLRRAVGLDGTTGASDKTVGRRDSYQQLRTLLLQS